MEETNPTGSPENVWTRPIPARPEREVLPAPPPDASALDLLLRRPDVLFERLEGERGQRLLRQLGAMAVLGHLVCGLIVGSFSGGMQWWAAPAKILGGMLVTAAICFPSLYIFVSFTGAEAKPRHVIALLLSLLALVGVFLAGFAPIAWVFSQSSTLVGFIGAVHLVIWLVSIFVSQRVVTAGLRHWKARRWGIVGFWVFVFVLTSLQMMTALRPLIGSSDFFFDPEKLFFLENWGRAMGRDPRTPY
jgi:hypothetical protein